MQKHIYDLRYEVDKNEWRARAKRSLVFQLWDRFKPNKQSYAMLDFGCGTGVLQDDFEHHDKHVKAYGIDISKEAIAYCKLRGLKRVATFTGKKIPFKDRTFDVVTAIDVLEHVKDDDKALLEIKRVLKPKSIGIFLVPAHQYLWSTRDVRLQHVRRYSPHELAAKCTEAGFTILSKKNVDFLLYFALLALCKRAPKKNGVADLGMETAQTNSVFNEVLYGYESLENAIQRFTTFPVGISSVVVVQK